jgi:excisionase family DNA binding protein
MFVTFNSGLFSLAFVESRAMERLLTADQVAELLGTTREAIYARCMRGQLPHVRLGPRQIRFDPVELQRFLQARMVCSSEQATRNVEAREA